MNKDLVSKKTRNEFREFLVDWILRDIGMEFEAAHIDCDREYDPQVSGERRSFVERHYHTLAFTNPGDVLRLITAYESILNTATRNVPTQPDQAAAKSAIEGLIASLRKDGFKYQEGKISPVTPEARRVFEEAPSGRSISEITRRCIVDAIVVGNVAWSGCQSEVDFLSRLYDLESLPSDDQRFENMAGDIWQHRVNNPTDWSEDWVFTDSRLDLMQASDEAFLRFLCWMIHPIVRPDSLEVESLLGMFNQYLLEDGWEIVVGTQISGKPVFEARRRVVDGSPALGSMKPLAIVLNAEYLSQQITRMEASIVSDPELAIGTAKELVETCCKTILAERGKPVVGTPDVSTLTKETLKELKLVPEGIPDAARGADVIKRLLNNLGTIGNGLAELRGLYGTGHGKHGKSAGLSPRHAKLAVGAAATLAMFLFETHQETRT